MHRRAFLARSAAALGLAAPALASPARAQALPAFTLQVGGNRPATIEVLTEPALEAGQLALVRRWVEMSAEALRLYYGRFPVPACRIVIDVGTYRSIGGAAYSGDIPQLEIRMPASASEQLLLRDDWVMTHEMTHLAFPWMRRRHNWLAEGLAVWVGSVVRVAAGHWPAEAMFAECVAMMPRGQPEPGEGGFEQTRSWGRTYWGGAIFCLQAEMRIRAATDAKQGLREAVVAINLERDFRKLWDIESSLALGDAALGKPILTDLYREMGFSAVTVDLDALWRDLGVVATGKTVAFDDTAPKAAWRRGMVEV